MGGRGRLVPLGLVVVGVLVTGCSWGSSPGAPATGAPSSPVGSPADGSTTPALSVPVARDLPFAQYGDAIDTLLDSTLYTADDRATFEAAEEDIAECMKSQGFEYTPRVFVVPEPWSFPWTSSPVMIRALPEDRDAVAADGYGTTDDIEEQRALEESLQQSSATPDPNAEYLASLSPQAQAEYSYALGGVRGFDDPDPDPSGGCAGRVFESSPPSAYEPFSELVHAIQVVVQRDVFEDARTGDLNVEWSSCMTAAGFDVTPPEEYRQSTSPGPNDAYDLAVVTAPDGSVLWPARGTPADEIPLEHRSLVGSDIEHAIALADFDCRRSTDYLRRFTDILAALEGEFVAEHAEELDAMVAAAAGG